MVIYQQGEHLAFSELYNRHAPKVYAYLKRRAPNQADDLLQTVFLKLHQSRSRYDARYPFLTWIFSIARNTLTDSFRKRNLPLAEPTQTDQIPSPSIGPEDSSADLKTVLGALPSSQQKLIEMRFNEGLSFDEIGRRLGGLSETSVRKRISRTIQRLRKLVGGGND